MIILPYTATVLRKIGIDCGIDLNSSKAFSFYDIVKPVELMMNENTYKYF